MASNFSLFSRKTSEELSPYGGHRVFSIESFETLLKTPARKSLLAKIKSLCQAPEKYYKTLYAPLIDKLADYLQCLPDINTFETEHETSWLDAALLRTAYALTLRHRMILPHGGAKEEVQQDYALWTYVVFSSSLLWHIGKLNSHCMISLCDSNGIVSKHWNPISQSLFQAGNFYKVRSIDKNGPMTFKQMTTVLARNLIPNEGFDWIASNEKALESWLLALVEESGSQGSLQSLLELAQRLLSEHPSLEEFALQFDYSDERFLDLESALLDVAELEKQIRHGKELPPVKISEPAETQLGEEFLRWLKKGIANRSIAINREGAHVHVSPDGVVLAYPEIFQDFCSMFYRNRNWITVYKQFNYLGLHKKSGADTWFGKFFLDEDSLDLSGSTLGASASKKKFTGIMLNHPRSLFNNNNQPRVNKQLLLESLQGIAPQYPELSRRSLGEKKIGR